jgi:hypothetical protein
MRGPPQAISPATRKKRAPAGRREHPYGAQAPRTMESTFIRINIDGSAIKE